MLLSDHGNLDAADHIESLRTHPVLSFLFNQRGGLGPVANIAVLNLSRISGWCFIRNPCPPGSLEVSVEYGLEDFMSISDKILRMGFRLTKSSFLGLILTSRSDVLLNAKSNPSGPENTLLESQLNKFNDRGFAAYV